MLRGRVWRELSVMNRRPIRPCARKLGELRRLHLYVVLRQQLLLLLHRHLLRRGWLLRWSPLQLLLLQLLLEQLLLLLRLLKPLPLLLHLQL